MFKVGDIVIHPGQGVCRIKDIIKASQEGAMYVIKPNKPVPGDFKILVGKNQIEECGIHHPINKRKIPEVLDVLEKEPNDLSEDGQKGFPAAKKKVQNGNLCDAAEALRDLEKCSENKYSSIKDSLMQAAKKELIEEISYVKKLSKEKVDKLIDERLKR